jgi:FG-GAP-like repeat
LFAAGITGTTGTPFISTQISLPKAPLVLRLTRDGNVWTGSWSTDGTTFTSAPNFTFDLNVAKIGPYAGTYASTAANSPSFTATVDYFFATSSPIANQDGPLPYGYATVDANPPGTTVEKTLADIQGTGQLEPVIGLEQYDVDGTNSNGGIYWYSYPTSGGVQGTWTIHTIINDGNAYEDMVPLDVNGDGAVDIIASYNNTSGNYQIVWFENPRGSGGDPTQPWVQHVIGPGLGENNLKIADIDGDGKPDVVTASSVFFQNSPDSWTQVQYSTSFRGIALLDIGSGHGAINLAGTGPSPFNAVWYENPRETGGNARTGTWIMHTIGATPYPCGTNNCADGGYIATLGTMDVNGDGLIDIVSGQSEGILGIPPPPGGLIWWQAPADRRNGTWIKHTIDANVVDTHEIAIADMNKDGNLDIVVAEQDQSPLRRVMVYYDDGKGNLTPEVLSNAEGHNIVVGNVTNNPAGELDILNCGHGYYLNPHPLQIFLNPY